MTDKGAPANPTKSFRKGALVRVNRQAYQNSLEAQASDQSFPDYIFEGPGELLNVKGEYGQIRWRMPVPDVWLKLEHLQEYIQ